MSKSVKLGVFAALVCIGIASGVYFFLPKNNNYPTFSINQKFAGQQLDVEEKKLFDKISSNNKKFINTLDSEQFELFNSIKNKVQEAVHKNSKVKIKYKDLLTKDEYEIVSLIRKYRKEMKAKNPVDKKLYASMMKKLEQDQAIELLLYVK